MVLEFFCWDWVGIGIIGLELVLSWGLELEFRLKLGVGPVGMG